MRATGPRGSIGLTGGGDMDDLFPRTLDWHCGNLTACEAAGLLHRDVPLADVIAHCRGGLAYLATPYSRLVCGDAGIFDESASYECSFQAARWSRLLALEGVTAVSPIIQAAELLHADQLEGLLDPMDAQFWEAWCRPLLLASDVVIVPPQPGWQESEGIWGEVCHALLRNRQVFLIADDRGAV